MSSLKNQDPSILMPNNLKIIPELLKALPRGSAVWKYFVKTSAGGKCKICQKEIKGSGNTTNLKFHVVRVHKIDLTSAFNNKNIAVSKGNSMHTAEDILDQDDPDNIADYISVHSPAHSVASTSSLVEEPTIKQPRIDITLSKQSSIQVGSKAGAITNKILFMIAKDNLPFKTVEKEGFKLLMKEIIPLFKIPNRQTVTNLMEEKYEVLSDIIKNELSQIKHLSLTTDIWTDPLNTKSYIGLTAHYILNNIHKTVTIGVTGLNERHTSENIETWLMSITKEWRINKKNILVVVSDSGANIKRGIKNAFGTEKHLSCFAHALNLIPSKVIEQPDISIIIKKVKSIVTHFKKSVFSADTLRTSSDLKLIQAVDTRWNSTHDMLQRFINLSDIQLNYKQSKNLYIY
ncbi:E3 SUMO-protein ligase ZBED1-like [Prorops nasuta]|uniref:E3 SUMO-protein ligase ZBED1-like n=1 Tax=Prorops nasuta TaxID=863751 RepID=UPI0034CF93AA